MWFKAAGTTEDIKRSKMEQWGWPLLGWQLLECCLFSRKQTICSKIPKEWSLRTFFFFSPQVQVKHLCVLGLLVLGFIENYFFLLMPLPLPLFRWIWRFNFLAYSVPETLYIQSHVLEFIDRLFVLPDTSTPLFLTLLNPICWCLAVVLWLDAIPGATCVSISPLLKLLCGHWDWEVAWGKGSWGEWRSVTGSETTVWKGWDLPLLCQDLFIFSNNKKSL